MGGTWGGRAGSLLATDACVPYRPVQRQARKHGCRPERAPLSHTLSHSTASCLQMGSGTKSLRDPMNWPACVIVLV